MHNLLFEILCEEIPAGMQVEGTNKICNIIKKLAHEYFAADLKIESWVTPRRIGLYISEIPADISFNAESVRGPKLSAPKQALEGFLKKHSANQNDLHDDGSYYYLDVPAKYANMKECMQGILEDTMVKMVWPKSMRWGTSKVTWVRPIVSMLCLFDGKVLPVRYGEISASNKTQGHRFLSDVGAQEITNFDHYKEFMLTQKVETSHAERMSSIEKQIEESIKPLSGVTLIRDQKLLEEIAGLVEWPKVYIGKIDNRFMGLPKEVLVIALKVHQRYLLLENADGTLAPFFVIVSNIEANDEGVAIINGNEKVLRARLADASFFYDQDKKTSLLNKNEKLAKVVFHQKIGSVYDKVGEIVKYVKEIAEFLNVDPKKCEISAQNCKADLVTEMVKEFPELQGIMGGYYAVHDGLGDEIAKAVRDHYKPVGPNDSLPENEVGKVVALADKLVTLNQLFAIDVKPTGSKDPFALRRAANGVIRLIGSQQLEAFFHYMTSKGLLREDVKNYINEREII